MLKESILRRRTLLDCELLNRKSLDSSGGGKFLEKSLRINLMSETNFVSNFRGTSFITLITLGFILFSCEQEPD